MPAHIFPLLSCLPANLIVPPTFTPPPPSPSNQAITDILSRAIFTSTRPRP
jgi:hypothetical protein